MPDSTGTNLEIPDSASAPSGDQELVNRCQQGDPQAFCLLYRRHQQRVRSLLFHQCGEDMLDDLVQDVFLRAWKGLPRFRQTAQFSTWLYRIAWNVAQDQRRRFAQQRSQLKTLTRVEATQQQGPDVMTLHYQSLCQQAINTLKTEHRMVLLLHDLEDWPQSQISEVLGIPVGTVKSRLFYARAAVRRVLQAKGVNP
ncbi:MAG: sigma-70 family RNA polymerase sigma factor [Cyanophyceae cyanobacterium]